MNRARVITTALLVAVTLNACRGNAETADDPPATTASTASTTLPPPTTTTTTPPTTTTSTTTTVAPTTTTLPPDPLQGLSLEVLASGLSRPTFVAALPEDTRIFVVEAVGRIRVVDVTDGLLPEPFLNIRNKVGSASVEQGLLGLAFHPDYPADDRFFVYYTDRSDNSVVAEYRVSDEPDLAVATEERVILELEQPDIRHNAGMLLFGPDGYLYIGTGDGGVGGARVNGQDPATLLSAILRIDVDDGEPYGVPADNPFADGSAGAPEVWAYGLRNPWRFSIDPVDGVIYIGDVGQAEREEINAVPLEPIGYNFGWPSVEGTRCFFESGCDPADYVVPVLDYTHDEGLSVTGGYVYRGAAIPELTGHYFYADWVREWIRSFRLADGGVSEEQDWTSDLHPGQINSFGLDSQGELLVATWDGNIARIVPVR